MNLISNLYMYLESNIINQWRICTTTRTTTTTTTATNKWTTKKETRNFRW